MEAIEKIKFGLIVGVLVAVVIGIITSLGLIFFTDGLADGLFLTRQFLPSVAAVLVQGSITIIIGLLCLSEIRVSQEHEDRMIARKVLRTFGMDEGNQLRGLRLGSRERVENIETVSKRIKNYMDTLKEPVFVVDEFWNIKYANRVDSSDGDRQLEGKYVNDVFKYRMTEEPAFRDSFLYGTYNEMFIEYKENEYKIMMIPINHKKKTTSLILMMSKMQQGGVEIDRQKRVENSRKEKISTYINDLKKSVNAMI